MNPMPICYVEIPAPEVEKAGAFYSSVFGWIVTRSNLGDQPYWMFSTGEGQLMGGFDSTRSPQSGGAILYIKVEDIPETLKTAQRNGAVVIREKFNIGGGYGFSAILEDPNGNHIGLWAAK